MSDLGARGEQVHSGAESVEPVWPHQQLGGPFAGLMEKIMSMTPMRNSEAMSNHVRELTNQANELTTDELENVSGGFNYGHIQWTYIRQKV
jgi:bacteriocin-like protein